MRIHYLWRKDIPKHSSEEKKGGPLLSNQAAFAGDSNIRHPQV